MAAPDSPASKSSKTQIFLRRLASTVVLWTVILAAMFSSHRFIADGVFAVLVTFLAMMGLMEFYGLAGKRGLGCFKVSGVVGGVLLMCGTFAHLHGWLGISNSPARVNDFETCFLILFVLGLCLPAHVPRPLGRPYGHCRDALGAHVCALVVELHAENQFFPRGGGKIFPALFHPVDEV